MTSEWLEVVERSCSFHARSERGGGGEGGGRSKEWRAPPERKLCPRGSREITGINGSCHLWTAVTGGRPIEEYPGIHF